MASIDIDWSSGEICQVVGRYYSRCCTGAVEHNFVVSDVFPFCKQCGKKLKWRRSFAGVLPIDTFETPAGGKKSRRKLN